MSDRFGLHRFVDAQDSSGAYLEAIHELRNGFKQGHWMWFVFPQIAGLGYSQMSQRYAISGLGEAAAYLAHPVLGARLVDDNHSAPIAGILPPKSDRFRRVAV